MLGSACPFCKRDPFHYVDNGVCDEAVAVNCCDLGYDLICRGTKQAKKIAYLKGCVSPRKQARAKRLTAEYYGD
jgi:hypothetical protein